MAKRMVTDNHTIKKKKMEAFELGLKTGRWLVMAGALPHIHLCSLSAFKMQAPEMCRHKACCLRAVNWCRSTQELN